MILENLSTPGSKALANGNSGLNVFRELELTYEQPSGDGVYEAGISGLGNRWLFLFPYAEAPKEKFRMRLYGWYKLQGAPASELPTWYPLLLQEFECFTGKKNGVVRGRAEEVGHIKNNEFLCDSVCPVFRGGTGGTGGTEVISRPGLIGAARVELMGALLFEFDFEHPDSLGMNCIWHRQ